MRWLGWIAIAALAGIAAGCADDNALYTSSKYVLGYTPPGSSSNAQAYDRLHDRNRSLNSRQQ